MPSQLENHDPKVLLDLCLLAMIESADSYGYGLAKELQSKGYPLKDERSLYPVLRRLENQELIESYLNASSGGPARKYYRITVSGQRALRRRAEHGFEIFQKARDIVTQRVSLDDGSH